MNKSLKLIFLFALLFFDSCKNQVQSIVTVYNNDFETQDLTSISDGIVTQYNGSAVLGQYNNGGFLLTLNLPKHDLVTISFDLYIHDTWDGNKQAPDGPDIWQMIVNNNTYINTTFSNLDCVLGNFCSPQSYPFNYPNNYNNPKTGAYKSGLPGVCTNGGASSTTQYKITKTFTHSKNVLTLQCLDKLIQTNSPDPKCDESWSVDNLTIKAITL